MKQIKSFFVIAVSAVLVLLTIGTTALAKENLKVVPNQRVCMVTNMVFPRDQIPVAHGGKTYYGCCQNCKQTLAQDASARTAQDPVTKRIVDKATAVIAAREDGSVIYFESQASLQKYQTRGK
ncbi:TRASH domain-containing protein [Bdellovibrio svalbardensis]|uniref:TRASH domain-containing protein n=1 Tax=Bdellovibrio svalbardensis TaxID=2972972 RepID=A0ABT6DGS5_9BACT|nr:TRASH domain-containing protein [Bdellovibrio svalbardensis]MDG0815672.1 TRASH domain-containing protein [Bdellovibrio svalbardensis]